MRKEGFFVTLIFGLLVGCSHTVQPVSKPLPSKWVAKEFSSSEARCATPRQTGFGTWWAFCDNGAHGRLSIVREDRSLVTEVSIPSTDRLAMAKSVSSQSTWVEFAGLIWVGTQDGRVLGLNEKGEIKKSRQFQDNTWFKDIALLEDELVVLGVRHQDVRVIKLDDDLRTQKEVRLSEARHEAELSVFNEAIFVATDLGFLVELNEALQFEHLWRLSPGSALGPMAVTATSVWVGNEEGRLYHVHRSADFTSLLVGKSAITTAPVITSQGVWVALDEEGLLKLIDSEHRVRRSVRVPMARTLLSFESVDYFGHTLLGVASDAQYSLLASDGEVLWQLESPGHSFDYLLSIKSQGRLWLGHWELSPHERDINLHSDRAPATFSR